jgi:transcription-repair coupling factor (superfamily II helicase)
MIAAVATHLTYSEIASGAEGFVAAQVSEESGRPLLFVATSDRELELVAAQLAYFTPAAQILTFPAWDCLPYDRVSPRQQMMAERMATIASLMLPSAKRRIIVTTVNALTQKLPPRNLLEHSSLEFAEGGKLDLDALTRFLAANGYSRVGKVMEAGEFAIRGSIVDLFPSGFEQGCRIDLFGDDIESIQFFDPLSQRSTGEKLTKLNLHPVSEAMLSPATIERFRNQYRASFGAVSKADPLYEAISSTRAFPGMEHWLPLFYDKLSTLYDFLPANTLTLFSHGAGAMCGERNELVQDYYNARQQFKQKDSIYHALPPEQLYILGEDFTAMLASRDVIHCTPFSEGIPQHIKRGRDFAPDRKQGLNPYELAAIYLRQQQENGKQVIITCISEGSAERLREKLAPHLLAPCTFAVLPLPHGFIAPEITVISEQDILGERQAQSARKKKRSTTEQFLAEAANFSEGELVVHREHGIGRFVGLITMEVQGRSHDCLKLVYAGEDKLFVPVENIDVLSRYGNSIEEGEAPLDKLGGTSWQARKAKLKERIKLAAEALLKIAAERELAEGIILTQAEGLYEEFCARFPYVETEDQEKAIADVLDDLCSGKPADRLICGDVGFGKTEVAMRAAFVAATATDNPVQVAIIAPTTLLARQHYKNFTQRFEGFPLKVRQFSRLATTKEMKEGIEGLADGSVNIAIGTHALLADRVKFKNLGLLVVDEEQHFGVKQKEKLKSLKSHALLTGESPSPQDDAVEGNLPPHVVTLSATPIPRTLQMALTGVRSLSLITTPPVDRLAVRTFVTPYDPVTLREALLREYHRGGQTFYVTPYISDIAELKHRITELVPELKLAVAHGQMPASELDEIMNDFYDGKYDVLLSTAIIESGIDVPTANTMIINRADRFGLSQLYQLRGRVGRSKTRAYAYLTLPHGRNFSANALKRLEVMQTLDTLGAGFSVASHDMDIRGFGNLVGEEQSGHIREVGVELYQHMLEEAVAEARRAKKGEAMAAAAASHEWRPQINLGLSVLIPESYVQDLDLRLGLYRRAAGLKTAEEIDEFDLELTDRFGTLPQEVSHFLFILKLKLLCVQAGVERLDAGPKGAVLTFYKNQVSNPQGLLGFISKRSRNTKLRADHKLVLMFEMEEEAKRLSFVSQMLAELVVAVSTPQPHVAA